MFDKVLDPIPEGLDDVAPGPKLAGLLAAIDVNRVSGYDRIVVVRAQQRMVSHHSAQLYEAMASVSVVMDDDFDDDRTLACQAAAAEIRAALRLTRRAADVELEFALNLKRRLPRVWGALRAGAIDVRRARVFIDGTIHLSIATARNVVDEIIERAPGLTTGQLGARIRKLCIETDPQEARERYEHAVSNRRVVAEATESGTANLIGQDLPPHRVAAAKRRINHLAQSLKTADESRSMDQLRADVLLDLLDGTASTQAGRKGGVDIQVTLGTLAGLEDHPGDLAGYGPVIADIVRQVAESQLDVEWRYSVTDPDSGRPIGTGITRERPTVGQRRYVEARDPVCIFPGCRMPAVSCDIDHRIPRSEGGPTTVTHLAPACRHDHVTIRHRMGWTYQPLNNGDYRWTSRLGHTYTTTGRSP